MPARSTNAPGEAAEVPTVTVEGPVRQDSASRSQIEDASTAADAVEIPGRIRRLLTKAPLVVDCEEASVWSADGRLRIGQSSPIEVLLYLAAAPLLHQGRLADWDGVKPETLLAEVWAPRARTPDNRDSGQTWLGKNLARLQDEIARAVGGLGTEMVVKRRGGLRLNDNLVLSDVEAFMAAAEKARTSHGTEQVCAAEEALATVVPGSCPVSCASQRQPDQESSCIGGSVRPTGSGPRDDCRHSGARQGCSWHDPIATLGAMTRRWPCTISCSARIRLTGAPTRAC